MSQDSEHWDLLQKLFYLGEETPPEDRERAFSEICADAAIVRRAIDILNGSALLDKEVSPAAVPLHPTRIGPYSLLRPIGSGGIGTVYLAERILGGVPQRSALKILSPHAAGDAFVERFRREQHILASLDHRHITRLFDAGLGEGGQPYLVMEYVEGEHLNAFCDGRNLGIRERLELFLQVCDAVSYLHRNLIVHLDLKPSNILVTVEGEVKLLDFGTSKLVQRDSLLTTTVLATPAYASPEQLRNEPVTTACDVYSLGAILFEILAGRRPGVDASAPFMIERAMRELEPEKLSKSVAPEMAAQRQLSPDRLRHMLRGDLETITDKSLRPRAKDRYPSVDALMQDVEHYLAGRPVTARPQTTFYRIAKFARRHRRSLSVSAVAAVLLIAALVYAEIKQRKALAEGLRAEQMQTFMSSLFTIANSDYFGKPTMSVNDFLNLGIRTLPLYIHEPADLQTGRMRLAISLWRNGDFKDAKAVFAAIAQASKDPSLESEALAYAGDIDYREGNLKEGERLTSQALALSHNSRVTPLARVTAEDYYAINREVNGQRTEENLHLLNQAAQEAMAGKLPAHDRAYPVLLLGQVMTSRNRLDEAASLYRQALQLYSTDPAYACTAADVEGRLGYIDHLRGRLSESLEHHQHAYATVVRCEGAESAGAS
ncbi:MAG TPA: serine/threonine-protein kinase, partial [Acidobacteriaceae bacterium]|nr:serine/threonine-protein kinase [Acidobacteriaceae bacterium]